MIAAAVNGLLIDITGKIESVRSGGLSLGRRTPYASSSTITPLRATSSTSDGVSPLATHPRALANHFDARRIHAADVCGLAVYQRR